MKVIQGYYRLASACALLAVASPAIAQAANPAPAAAPVARALAGHTGQVRAVAFFPDGRTLISGGDDGAIREWDVQSGKPGRVFIKPGAHPSSVRALAVAPDGATFISGDVRGVLRLWNAHTGAVLAEPDQESQDGGILFIVFSPRGKRVLTVSDGVAGFPARSNVCLRDTATLAVSVGYGTGRVVHSAAISPDGSVVALGSSDGASNQQVATLWDLETAEPLHTAARFGGGNVQFAFAADGRKGIVSDGDSLICYDLDLFTRRKITLPGFVIDTIPVRSKAELPYIVDWVANDNRITSFVCSPDSRILATVSGSKHGVNPGLIVRVWDGLSGALKAEMKDGGEITGIAFSPDAKVLAGAGKDGNVRLWDIPGLAGAGPMPATLLEPPLIAALNRGSSDRALALLAAGADFHARGREQLAVPILAARCGALDVLKWLAAKGEDLGARGPGGGTALMWASSEGRTAVMDYLLAQKVDKNARTTDGETALMSAATMGEMRAVRLLVKQGVDLDTCSDKSGTALVASAVTGQYGIAKLLVESGANVDLCGKDGVTPLMAAIRGTYGNIARMLLEHHADVGVMAKDGSTALALAERAKMRELMGLINAAAASQGVRKP